MLMMGTVAVLAALISVNASVAALLPVMAVKAARLEMEPTGRLDRAMRVT